MSDGNTILTRAQIIQHTDLFVEDVSSLYLNDAYSDVILIVDGIRFSAHRNILKARSEYFRALLSGGMQETFQREIDFKDQNPIAFKALLRYIYTGKILLTDDMEIELTIDLMGLANKYGFIELELALLQYFKEVIGDANCCQIIEKASSYYLPQLIGFCLDYADKNATEILQSESLLNLSSNNITKLISRETFCALEIKIFQGVLAWVKHNPESDSTEVVSKIRLPLIKSTDFLDVVRPSGLVIGDVILDAINEQRGGKQQQGRGYSMMADVNVMVKFASVSSNGEILNRNTVSKLLLNPFTSFSTLSAFHRIEENAEGIIIELKETCVVNYVRMLLSNDDESSFSYYLEVSLDRYKWKRVVDYTLYLCRFTQNLYFEPQLVKYFRIVGTRSTATASTFCLCTLKAMYSTTPLQTENDLLVPKINIATRENSAYIISGIRRGNTSTGMIDGATVTFYGESFGYTSHRIASGSIIVQLPQPYLVNSMSFYLMCENNRHYKYLVEVSTDQQNWQVVADKRQELCKSQQHITFNRVPVSFIRLTGTYSDGEDEFRCTHFQCPSENV